MKTFMFRKHSDKVMFGGVRL